MSYRGRPSKGCESCRNRKVKCDEKKPVCNRCSRTGHECAYRDHADLLFRNQTAVAAQRAEDAWRKRSKTHQVTLSESDGSATAKSPPSDRSSLPISSSQSSRQSSPREARQGEAPLEPGQTTSISVHNDLVIAPDVTPNLYRQAYDRFLYDFVFPQSPNRAPGEPTDALWSFIPILYQNAAKGSSITTAVDALAYINYANRCNAPQAEALAEACLAKTISSLSKAVADRKVAATNATLCSVYLLGVYENFTIQQRRGTITAHQHGASALLHLRPIEEYYDDAVSSRIYEMIFWQQLLGNMQIGKRPPVPTQNTVSVKESLLGINSSFNVTVMQLIWREAMIHAEWYETKRSEKPPASRRDLQALLRSALDLEGEFRAWPSTTLAEWNYSLEPNTPEILSTCRFKWQKLILGTWGGPEEIHSYPSLKKCWIWAFYRTTHLFLLRDLLEMLNWMLRLPEQDYLTASATPNMPLPSGLDNGTLHRHHSFATNQLVCVIEKSCSSILSNFTIPVYTKSLDDIVGMRGYMCIRTLGTVDAILASGLVPDVRPSASNRSARASQTRLPLIPNTSPQHSQLAYRHRPTHEQHWTDVVPQTASPKPSATSTPVFDAIAKKGHIFDPGPRHPYDHPVDFAELGLRALDTRTIDVAARREWLNCVLYWIGTRLGIKKALYVPITEKYMTTVERIVNRILDD